MRFLTTYLLLLSSIICFGQAKEKVTLNEIVIGKNLLTEQDIKAKEYAFTEKIFDAYIDSLSKHFTVQLRGINKNGKWKANTGRVVMYDAGQQKVLWNTHIVHTDRDLEQYGDFLIQRTTGKSRCVDINTGYKRWDVNNTILFADSKKRIALGYKYETLADVLEAINLDNGKTIWQRKIPAAWERTFQYNDSILYVVADGLHRINLNNGKGWIYDIKTVEDFSGYVTATDVVSNIFPDDDRLYIAGSAKLACIDKQGKEIWSVKDFMHSYLSRSSLYTDGNILYMINTGLATVGGKEHSHGRPFVAAFDKQTGKKLFLHDFPFKKNPITDYDVDEDNIYLLFDDRILRYTVSNNRITEQVFNTDSIGKLHFFIGAKAYLPANQPIEGSYQSLRYSDMTRQYFYTDKQKVYILDDMKIISNADIKNFHTLYLTSKRHQFITKSGETTLLDNYGRAIAKLKMSKNSFLRGHTLYDMQDNRIIEVNLEGLLID